MLHYFLHSATFMKQRAPWSHTQTKPEQTADISRFKHRCPFSHVWSSQMFTNKPQALGLEQNSICPRYNRKSNCFPENTPRLAMSTGQQGVASVAILHGQCCFWKAMSMDWLPRYNSMTESIKLHISKQHKQSIFSDLFLYVYIHIHIQW